MPKRIDKVTRSWIKNKSDEIAAQDGYRFDEKRGLFTVDWMQEYCYLYEGFPEPTPIKLIPWAKESVMRIYGWVKYSDERKMDIRRFRKAAIWVPKKNGKSPLLACNGIYQLCGEREFGRKCFSVALDGKQAMIGHTHAMQMIRASPALNAECEINKATGRITHVPTQSVYAVVSGDNVEGQEGLNANYIGVDENHVVSAKLMSVLEFAGISRAEPLQLEVSTAGNNPDGYGKKQFDYGRSVESGAMKDNAFFHVDYSMPSDITDAELDKKIVSIGKAANPSWGVTVFESEFVSSYERAKRSLSTLLDFKMYRLNIWQSSTNPWLKYSDWLACGREIKAKGIIRRDAYGGLDLSRVNDMTAFVAAIPDDDGRITLIPRFWLPERYAKMNNHLAPFLKWAEEGFLTLCPGDTVDYTMVRGGIRKLCKHLNLISIAYDQMFAETITQELSEGVFNSDTGEEIESGLSCERFAFPQTISGYAQPTADFEADICDGKIIHPNSAVFNWMISHVSVEQDSFGRKRPVKPDSKRSGNESEYRKIDGVVAAIMACALARNEVKNAYNDNPVLFV